MRVSTVECAAAHALGTLTRLVPSFKTSGSAVQGEKRHCHSKLRLMECGVFYLLMIIQSRKSSGCSISAWSRTAACWYRRSARYLARLAWSSFGPLAFAADLTAGRESGMHIGSAAKCFEGPQDQGYNRSCLLLCSQCRAGNHPRSGSTWACTRQAQIHWQRVTPGRHAL